MHKALRGRSHAAINNLGVAYAYRLSDSLLHGENAMTGECY